MNCSQSLVTAALAAATCLAVAPPTALAQVGKSVSIVDANVATEQQLSAIPQLTPALVKSILARRPFPSVTELDALLGQTLSPEQRTTVYGRLFVHLNLNTATREQILLIPNAGPRMVREFQEYRPYKALAQFHREIGKYVDDTELARLSSTCSCRSISTPRAMPISRRFPASARGCSASSRNTARTRRWSGSAARSASTSTTRKWRGWSVT